MTTAAEEIIRVLEQRGGTHGSYRDNAAMAVTFRKLMRSAPGWDKARPEQQLSLDEIQLKIARFLSEGADINEREIWLDIAGYAIKGLESIPPQAVAPAVRSVPRRDD